MICVTPSYLTKSRPRPCRREAAAKAGKSCGHMRRRRVGRVQMQNIDDRAICFVDCCCSMLIRGCSAVCCLFFFQARAISEERSFNTQCSGLWGALGSGALWALGRVTAPNGHRTARAMHALPNASRWRRLKPFASLP